MAAPTIHEPHPNDPGSVIQSQPRSKSTTQPKSSLKSANVQTEKPVKLANVRAKEPIKSPKQKKEQGQHGNLGLQLFLAFLSLGLFTVIVLFVQATYAAEASSQKSRAFGNSLLKVDVSTSLSVLRAAQGVLSAIMSIALGHVLDYVQWKNMGIPDGLPYLNLLALSPTTGSLGLFGLILSSATNSSTKAWASIRFVHLINRS
jgi:hypothetical protein